MEAILPKIAIVDDHPWIRLGLISLLQNDGGFEVCGEAESAEQALELIARTTPTIAIVDISLKGPLDGIELTRVLTLEHPTLSVLVLSMHAEPKYAVRALAAGASDYISKSEAPDNLISTLRGILQRPRP